MRLMRALLRRAGPGPNTGLDAGPIPRPPLIVLGMHRSGTSFLTGSLQLAGLDLGKHSTADKYNPKGNRENADIVAFHSDVLAARGAAWNAPPDAPVVFDAAEQARARALLAAYDRTGPWGFKDPRSLLMLPAWAGLCPDARFVGIFRNPVAVARSLVARFRMPEEQALALWRQYNAALIALHDRAPFPLFCFDADAETLHASMNAAFPALGLQPLSDEVFFSPDLRHHESPPEVIPEDVRPLYDALKARQC
jgi:hypothetical protein